MKLGENAAFLAVFLVVAASVAGFYLIEAQREEGLRKASPVRSGPDALPAAAVASASTTTSFASSSTVASSSTTSTTAVPEPTTTLAAPEAVSSSTSSTSATKAPIDSTTTTAARPNPFLEKYSGKGYRQAYLDVTYFCPSCAPEVVALLSRQPGVLSKSLGYRQKSSYVIYDPRVVKLERIVELAGASAGATLLNDTEI